MNKAEPSRPSTDADYIASLARSHDRTRYYAGLFAPADQRGHLNALAALNAEVRRIPASVAEPGLGEIRFQWWQDAISTAGADQGQTPVMRQVARAIRDCRLPADALVRLAEAHRDDLYGNPWNTLQDMEGFFGATDSALFQLSCLVLGGEGRETAETAGHAGMAYGLTDRLCRLPYLKSIGQQIASNDLLEIFDIEPQDMFGPTPPDGLTALLGHLIDLATDHLKQAEAALQSIPKTVRPAFLPMSLVRPRLKRLSARHDRLWRDGAAHSDLTVLARITLAALRRR